MTQSNDRDRNAKPGNAPSNPVEAAGSTLGQGEAQIKTGGWVEAADRAVRKNFPDPGASAESLRIALTAEASADINSHAKESLDAEVCGVLVGQACEDDHGPWVSVKAAIRGDSARQGGAHVTYTQETWQKIHEVKDRKYPKLAIVGWYHTHPGFGVEFSAMDKFIQEHFFSGPAQIALVLDPLSGDEAVCVNTKHGIEPVMHFWVEGKRRTCRGPAKETASTESGGDMPGDTSRRLRALEERLQQVLQASDEERLARNFWRTTIGMLFGLGLVAWITMTISRPFWTRDLPPEDFTYEDMPVRIGNDDALVGVKLVKWKLPDRLHAAFLKALHEQLEAQAKEKEEAEKPAKDSTSKTDSKAAASKPSAADSAKSGSSDKAPAAEKIETKGNKP